MRSPRRVLVQSVLSTLLATGLVMVAAQPMAGEIVPPVDTGKVGLHGLQASTEYPTITCVYEGGVLDVIRISPPRVFARDRTGGVDSQVVAWRWEVVYFDGDAQTYAVWRQGPRVKAAATDRRSASFAGPTADMRDAPDLDLRYEVRYRLSWYRPRTSSDVQGRALHYAPLYRKQTAFLPNQLDGCPRDERAGLPGETPDGHTGKYGLHFLIDSLDTASVICRYRDELLLPIVRLRVRQPMVFGRDTGPGIQTRTVGWRFVIQTTEDPPFEENAVWTFYDRLPFVRATATDRDPAAFLPRTYDFAPDIFEHEGVRVRVEMRWYDSGGSVIGEARDFPVYHARAATGIYDIADFPCPTDYD